MKSNATWTPPKGTLGELTEKAYARARALSGSRDSLEQHTLIMPVPPRLADALRGETVAVIAEVKRQSPSRGMINPGIRTDWQALAYTRGGAAALSILTEPTRFGGTIDDLAEAGRTVPRMPLLRKDFIVDPVQIVEARCAGASAVLLIARAMPDTQLRDLAEVARAFELEPLIEVRDARELEHALNAGAGMIGVNHRDLETLEIDPDTSRRVLPLIPRGSLAIAESGLASRADIERVAAIGADAVLVGSAVSSAEDPEAAVRLLTQVPRHERGRERL